jgi:hypothetical protein
MSIVHRTHENYPSFVLQRVPPDFALDGARLREKSFSTPRSLPAPSGPSCLSAFVPPCLRTSVPSGVPPSGLCVRGVSLVQLFIPNSELDHLRHLRIFPPLATRWSLIRYTPRVRS